MLTFYHYKRCSTCVKAKKSLISRGRCLKEIDITTTPPSARILAALIKKSGRPYTDFLNRSGVQYRDRNMKEKVKSLNEAEVIRLMALDGRLIKRPIVTDGNKVTVGFKEAEYEQAW
ncbi:MAG: ArsC/Spx/MgsR family protein [Nitrospira sp.]|nr:arsenate reductase family protein [Candidatus Manganitrophaceae bacterium]HIL34665.1 arsenate reductase family protein [Candidatus Manganitrophaceae bacterium]